MGIKKIRHKVVKDMGVKEKMEYYPVCAECGLTHCCKIPSDVHDGTLESVLQGCGDDVEHVGDDHACVGSKPWPSVMGTVVRERKEDAKR